MDSPGGDNSLLSLLERQTLVVKYFRKSNRAMKLLKRIQADLHQANPDPITAHHRSLGWEKVYSVRPIGLVIAGKTRWWSKLKQNKRFVRLRRAIEQAAEELSGDDSVPEDVSRALDFSPADWKFMEFLFELCDPLKMAIKELEGFYLRFFVGTSQVSVGEKYPTLSLVVKHVYSLQTFLIAWRDYFQHNNGQERAIALVKFLLDEVRILVASLPDAAYYACLLDPRYFGAYLPADARRSWWDRLESHIDEQDQGNQESQSDEDDESAMDPASPPTGCQSGRTRSSGPPIVPKPQYKAISTTPLNQVVRQHSERRPIRELLPLSVNPLVWWQAHQSIYPGARLSMLYNPVFTPHLPSAYARLARIYLALPATSAPCERLFSTAGRVLEKRRAALSPESASDIVFVHNHIDALDSIDQLGVDHFDD